MFRPFATALLLATHAAFLQVQQAPQWPQITWRSEVLVRPERDTLVGFSSVRIGPRQQILVPQQGLRRYLLFDSAGRRVAVIGRAGDGPGEFRQMGTSYGWMRDSIWAWDGSHERFSVFSSSGRFVRSAELGSSALVPQFRGVPYDRLSFRELSAAYDGGRFLVSGGIDARAPEQMRQFCGGGCFFVMDTTPSVTSVVARDPPDVVGLTSETRGTLVIEGQVTPQFSSYDVAIPFAHRTLPGVSPDGQLLVFVTTTGVPRGVHEFRVVALRSTGDTVFSRRVPYAPDRISPRMADSAYAEGLARIRTPLTSPRGRTFSFPAGLVSLYQERARAMIPDAHQPYASTLITRDQSTWIRLRSTQQIVRWIGIDSAGRNIGALDLPRNLSLVEVDGAVGWGIETDSLDLPVLLKLRFSGVR